VFVGPDVEKGAMDEAYATQIAPTFAKLLKLEVEYSAKSIF
jgi:hypothetical protein